MISVVSLKQMACLWRNVLYSTKVWAVKPKNDVVGRNFSTAQSKVSTKMVRFKEILWGEIGW